MKTITRATLTALGFLPLSLFADNLMPESTDVLTGSRVIAELQQGSKTGGMLDALMPFYGNQDRFWYANLQAYKYGDKYQTISLGVGHRQAINNAVLGFYGFYDRQTSENSINYNRINVGAEHLGETWDARLNFYYYLNNTTTHLVDKGKQSTGIQGTSLIHKHLYLTEKVYNGASVEFGRTLGLDSLRGYLGYYNYGNKIAGPSARIQYQFNDRISFSASTQHDTARGWLTTGGVQYWFGKPQTHSGKVHMQQRMHDPVVRDMTVAAEEIDPYYVDVKDPRSIYFASSDPSHSLGAGTEFDPTSLTDALNRATEGDIVYIAGTHGTPYDITGGVTVKDGQTLWGSSQDLYFDGQLLISAKTSANPELKGGPINVIGSATLGGFNLTGVDGISNGINVTSPSGTVTINNVNFSGSFTNAAVNIAGAGDVYFTNSTINANGASGIVIANTAGTVTIDTITLGGTYTNAGIHVNGSSANAIISNSQVTNNDSNAIVADNGSTLELKATSLKSTNANGLLVDNGSTALLDNVTANESGENGILVKGQSTITVNDSFASGNKGGAGMKLMDSSIGFITGSEFEENSMQGLNSQNSTVTISNSAFNKNTLSGLLAEQDSKIDISGSQFKFNTGYGLESNDSDISARDSAFDINAGGISANNSTLAISDSSFNLNATTTDDTEQLTGNGIRLDNASQATLDNITSEQNLMHGILVNQGSNAVLSNSSVNSNSGSGMRLNDLSSATITGTSFQQNRIYGLNSQSSNVTITGSTFNKNTLSGLLAEQASEINASDSLFNENGKNGLESNNSTITARDSFFDTNVVGLSASASHITLINSTFNSNHTLGDGDTDNSTGNGILLDNGSTAELTNITANTNVRSGMRILNSSTANITGSEFKQNQTGINGQEGSAVTLDSSHLNENQYGYFAQNSTLSATNSTFNSNTDNGILSSGGDLTLKGSEFNNNGGHGVDAYGGTTANIESSSFNNNGLHGLFVNDNTTDITAIDSTFNANEQDGIKAQSGATVNISGNSEVKDNKDDGLFASGATITMTGGTITGNGAAAAEVQINGIIHLISTPESSMNIDGEIHRTDRDDQVSSVTINGEDQFTNLPGQTETKTCTTAANGDISCS